MIAEREVTRRNFLKIVGSVGAGFALGSFTAISGCSPKKAVASSGSRDFAPNGYLKIEPDGTITVTIFKSDMGQGVRTSMAMLVAEELDADWDAIKVVQAPASAAASVQGLGVGGSSSTQTTLTQMRQIGAAAKTMLVAAAAQGWGVDPSSCTTSNGIVMHEASGRSAPYKDLLSAANTMPVPNLTTVRLKDPKTFKIVGKPRNRIDNPLVVTGKAKYGIDVKIDGMKYAVIARPPTMGGSLKSFDAAEAKKIEGVTDVVKVASGVAVVATNTWAAIKGRNALKITWDPGPNPNLDTASILTQLKSMLTTQKPAVPAGGKSVEATLDLPYLAHATMEPMNAVADFRDGRCDIWVGTQNPGGAQQDVATLLGIAPKDVTVNVMLVGGGFGRRGTVDYAVEAADVSRAAKAPIKLLWTREDDMRNDFYRPMSHHSFFGAVDKDGNPAVWLQQAVLTEGNGMMKTEPNAQTIYALPAAQCLIHGGIKPPVRTGAWRSVINGNMVPANECFFDVLAHLGGKDPLELRLKLVGDPRLKTVLKMAADKVGWDKPLPPGSGRGIACFNGYLAAIAHVVELTVKGDEIHVDRVVAVIDVGMAVNPRGIEAQIQGCISDGLATALRAEITVDKGEIVQSSWDNYLWMTPEAMPKVEVYIIQTGDKVAGMGETGYPSVPPAVANAVFAATGKRVRKFPIKVSELV